MSECPPLSPPRRTRSGFGFVIRGATFLVGPIGVILAINRCSWVGGLLMVLWSFYWGWRFSGAVQDYETLGMRRRSHRDPNSSD